mgnify:CR=1 FL=1
MDVKKSLTVVLSCILLAACSNKSNNSGNFSKAEIDECKDLTVQGEKIVRWKSGRLSKVLFKNNNQKAIDKFLRNNKNSIDFVENNYKVFIPQQPTVNLSLLRRKEEVSKTWGVERIGADKLWLKVQQNKVINDVTVAVIDSGINISHPQLVNQLFTNNYSLETSY